MKKKKAIILIILIAIMVTIFNFSSHTGSESSQLSIKVTRFICRIIFRGYGGMDISHQQFLVTELHHFVRKLAHFTIYAALGFFMYIFMETTGMRLGKKILLSWLLCACYAAADEFHQSFTPGRAMMFTDVLIDSAGALCGTAVSIIVIAVIMYIRSELAGTEKDHKATS